MAENHLKLTIYINRDVARPVIAKQFDAASRFFDVTLVDDNGSAFDLTNHKVRFNATKPDGRFIFNDAEITDAKNGKFTVELTDQTLAVGNKTVKADISVFTADEKRVLTTRTFEIFVEATQRNDAALESLNEYGAILKLLQDATYIYSIIKQDIVRLQTFDFDNLAALDRVTKITDISENGVAETIINTPDGRNIAERATTFTDGGTIEVIKMFAEDGIRVMKESKIVTSFDGKKIYEAVEGYDDYTLNAAYLSEIRIDGGEF